MTAPLWGKKATEPPVDEGWEAELCRVLHVDGTDISMIARSTDGFWWIDNTEPTGQVVIVDWQDDNIL